MCALQGGGWAGPGSLDPRTPPAGLSWWRRAGVGRPGSSLTCLPDKALVRGLRLLCPRRSTRSRGGSRSAGACSGLRATGSGGARHRACVTEGGGCDDALRDWTWSAGLERSREQLGAAGPRRGFLGHPLGPPQDATIPDTLGPTATHGPYSRWDNSGNPKCPWTRITGHFFPACPGHPDHRGARFPAPSSPALPSPRLVSPNQVSTRGQGLASERG